MDFVRKPLDRLQFSLSKQLSTSTAQTPTLIEYHPIQETFLNRFVLQEVQAEPTQVVTQQGHSLSLPMYTEKALLSDGQLADGCPLVQFLIYYDIVLSKLRLQLHHVTNLSINQDKRQQSMQCDPFVTVQLYPDKELSYQCQAVRSSNRPVFQFEGLSAGYVKLLTLVVRVYSDAAKNGACLGVAYLPLCDADLFGGIMQMVLSDTEEEEFNSQGDLFTSLSYCPVSHKIEGILHKVTGLRKQDLLGKARLNPYIKLVVKYKEKILYEWKSYVKRCTVSPVFNESFSYEIEDLSIAFDIENVQLLFYVLDNDFFMQDTSIGVVKIGKGVNICSSGRNHWIKALQYPSECVSSWHPIQPVQ